MIRWISRRGALILFLIAMLLAHPHRASAGDFAFGADLSYLKQVEDAGVVFKEDGKPKPGLQIFHDHGYNWIRLRVCVEPATLPNNIEYTRTLALAAKKMGYKFLLDFMYSNSWADPIHQPPPKAWEPMSHAERVKALFEYTRDTVAAFRDADVLPDMIQVGNEIGNGILWPDAELADGRGASMPENWDKLADYLNAGINGIDAGRGNNKRPKIMLHVDHGGDIPKTRNFFDHIRSYDIPYDVIGFSFYPWSHGTLIDLRNNFAFASRECDKDVMLVETGYYYQPSRYFRELPGPFPETPDGQRQWLEEVTQVVMQVPGDRGKGVFWWEPAGNQGLRARGYFDRDGNAQPIIGAFDKYTRPLHRTDGQ
jgi:arabinogalactan endo-1,4-beta-galactosidase